MDSIAANGFEFEITKAGPAGGEAVILLHGFPQTAYQWRHQINTLADAGYRVVAPNLRGISPGARPGQESAYHIDHLQEDVIAIADALGHQQFHLVGHDWGGLLAWYLATNFPKRLLSLCSVSTPHPAAFRDALLNTDCDQAQRSSYVADFRQAGSEDFFTADNASVLRSLYQSSGVSEASIEHYLDYFSAPQTLKLFFNWYRQTDLETVPELAAITVPTLYVWGDDDIVLGETAALDTENHVSADYRLEVLAGIGHWLPEQAAEQLNQHLLAHLKTYSARS